MKFDPQKAAKKQKLDEIFEILNERHETTLEMNFVPSIIQNQIDSESALKKYFRSSYAKFFDLKNLLTIACPIQSNDF